MRASGGCDFGRAMRGCSDSRCYDVDVLCGCGAGGDMIVMLPTLTMLNTGKRQWWRMSNRMLGDRHFKMSSSSNNLCLVACR
jgi:hypothetical protein